MKLNIVVWIEPNRCEECGRVLNPSEDWCDSCGAFQYG